MIVDQENNDHTILHDTYTGPKYQNNTNSSLNVSTNSSSEISPSISISEPPIQLINNDVSSSFPVNTTRSRSGTLQSSILNSFDNFHYNGGNTINNKSLTGSPIHVDNNDSLKIPNSDSLSFGLTPSSSSSTPPPPTSSLSFSLPTIQDSSDHNNNFITPTSKRTRSGSLFSTHSIWNDDATSSINSSTNNNKYLSLHNNNFASDSNQLSSFLSPTVNTTAPNSITQHSPHQFRNQYQPQPRNRSYTTTATTPNFNKNGLANASGSLFSNTVFDENSSKIFQTEATNTPFVSISNRPGDINDVLDKMLISNVQTSRLRSQTYSGSTPVAVYNNINSSSMQEQQMLQNQIAQLSTQRSRFVSNDSVQPKLVDDYDFSQLLITTNFENSTLGPTNILLYDNLPFFMDSHKLLSLLVNFSSQKSTLNNVTTIKITTTTTSKLALVECSNIDTAMSLKAIFNHFEIVPGTTLYVAFAKVDHKKSQIKSQNQIAPTEQSQPIQPHQKSSEGLKGSKSKPPFTDILSIQDNLIHSIKSLSSNCDMGVVSLYLRTCLAYDNNKYRNDFGPLPDPIPLRQFDSSSLRELRKTLENKELNHNNDTENELISEIELEELCLAMLDELPELCYDYLGNTIVQKVFSLVSSPLIKLMMVKEIAPYLTQLGIHKNGTWAIQKIVSLAKYYPQQMCIIASSLKPYAMKLFNDQFGNYVIQGCINFSSPYNNFVFESIIDNFLEISFGRFGSRCIRTILETNHDPNYSCVTTEQILLVASLIVEYADKLVVNSNGSLLITWYLDSFIDSEVKTELLVMKFISNLKELCTHKLANLTILKILNNRTDQKSKKILLSSIFNNQNNLEYILQDNETLTSAGPSFVYKILSNPIFSDSVSEYIPLVRKILLEINIVNYQNYKKLMEEVGLPNNRYGRGGNHRKSHPHNYNNNSNNKAGKKNNHNFGFPSSSVNNQQVPYQPYQIAAMTQHQIPYMDPHHYMTNVPGNPGPINHHPSQQFQSQQYSSQFPSQDVAVMQQLEQLSLTSAALGYNSNPGTPTMHNNIYM